MWATHVQAASCVHPLLGGTWSSSDIPVSYLFNPSGTPSGALSAIQSALATWATAPGSLIDVRYDGTTTDTATGLCGTDTKHVAFWGNRFNTPSSLAVALVCVDEAAQRITDADMEFNTTVSWATDGSGGVGSPYDIQSVALHEFGHWWGMDHPTTRESVMFNTYQGIRRSLGAVDEACIQTLYPGTRGGQNQTSQTTPSVNLGQNGPNPFRPRSSSDFTLIPFSLSQSAHVTIRIFNLDGELVKTLLDNDFAAGSYTTRWFGDNGNTGQTGESVASGVYLYHLKLSTGEERTKKLMLIR
ncbi:MAG: matrixin family metalloprotease [Elusimicrobia bacterium]|nr:matrixin family metalloprotease [Elusimicrobiota bacterium]